MVGKFGPFARGAAAAKTIFATSSNSQIPSFFISTPQFNRQKSQLGFHLGEGHRQSFTLDTGSVAVAPGYNFSVSTAVNNDDEDKDTQRVYPSLQYARPPCDVKGSDPQDIVEPTVGDTAQELSGDQSDVEEIKRLLSQGRHEEVLEYIDAMENAKKTVSIEAYNIALASLIEISLKVLDISPVLEAYQTIIKNMTPPAETYNIVLAGLLRMSKALEQRRDHLNILLGPPDINIESVGEIYESVAIADHLKIAASIIEALSADQVDQELYNETVYLCCLNGIDVSKLLSRCTMQAPHIFSATSYAQATEVYNTNTATLEDHTTMIDACFRFGEADAAMAMETPQSAEHITVALARQGYVSTAWQRVQSQKLSFTTECRILAHICNHNILSTATLMFDKIVASKDSRAGVSCAARSAYIRMCSRLGEEEMLLKAIKESQLRFAVWDPSTILQSCSFLIGLHPQLAVELFVVHTRRLSALWANNDLKSFSGQELMDAFMVQLEGPGPISVFCALILSQSPFVIQSAPVRQKIFETVWNARLNGDSEYVEFMSEAPETLLDIVSVHSDYIINNETHFGVALPFDIQSSLHKIYPLLVSDIITNKLIFSKQDAAKITRCLQLLKIKTKPWEDHCAEQEFLENSSSKEDEAAIKSYANTTNGIDSAIELFERQLLLRKLPRASVLRSIVEELVRLGDEQRYLNLNEIVLDRADVFDKYTLIAYHKVFVTAAELNPRLAKLSAHALESLDSVPCARGFTALIKVSNASRGMALFTEAIANKLATPQVYDAVLQSICRAGMVSDVEKILSELPEAISLDAQTFKAILNEYLRADREVAALGLMELMLKSGSGYERTTDPYNKLLEYYVFQKQDRKAALKIFAYMKQVGVILSPHSYKLLIDTWLLKPMDLAKADRVLETMRLDKAVPTTHHFSSLLRARGIMGQDLESAQAFYRGLVKNSRVYPDQHIFAALMMSYIANGKSSELPKVLDEMAKYQVNAHHVAKEIQLLS